MQNKKVNILGIQVDTLTVEELHKKINNILEQQEHKLILNVNVNCLNLTVQHPHLHHFLNTAEIVFCDGFGVMLGAKILGHHLPERITYADWMWKLAEYAEPRNFTFFFLGARPGIAKEAANRLQSRHKNLKIVGIQDGYFNKAQNNPENDLVIQKINAVKPNILVLGLGMPLQETWLMENWSKIDANIALTGGAVFDYLSGDLRRAPKWMTDNGLEWLGRLLIEPRRLWKRYVLGNPLFLWRVLKQRFGFKNTKPSSLDFP